MISKIYSPCTLIDAPQLHQLLELLVIIRYSDFFNCFSDLQKESLNEFILVFRSHLSH